MAYEVVVKDIKEMTVATVRAKTTLNKVAEKAKQLMAEVGEYLDAQGIKPTGLGFGVYYETGAVVVDMEVGYPVDTVVEGTDRVKSNTLPAVKAATTIYEGPHQAMPEAHRAVHGWMHDHDVPAAEAPAREVFITDLRELADGEDCKAESQWPVNMPPSRAERRREARSSS
jgi:effector-binding domain-containing protein